ncbi:MAG: hypothetical protein RL417_1922 [Pseudomonadota bacterium]|jgi:hypothetical protein
MQSNQTPDTSPEREFKDKVSTRIVRSIESGVQAAEDSVRETAVAAEPPPPPPVEAEPRRKTVDAPTTRRETVIVSAPEGVDSFAPAEEVSSSDGPIRNPEEATRVAERVSREIVANPTQALAVNINVAAVRALFS